MPGADPAPAHRTPLSHSARQRPRLSEGSSSEPAALDQLAQRGFSLCSASVRQAQALHVETEAFCRNIPRESG